MMSMSQLARAETPLDSVDIDWLRALLADWHIIADLGFADLLLYLPRVDGTFVVAGHVRPTTAPTAIVDDLVGRVYGADRRPMVDSAFREGRIRREGASDWWDDLPVRVEAIPVRRRTRQGLRTIGVVTRNTNLTGVRTPSRLELSYLDCATLLAHMLSTGDFPLSPTVERLHSSPRVSDGMVRVDAAGRVFYASPNAVTAFRRVGITGEPVGLDLATVARRTLGLTRSDQADFSSVLSGAVAGEVDIPARDQILAVRSLPLRSGRESVGALLLVRDVTDVRRQERALMSKDATIREIHHRVKNNLQTVAALLRLQARRIDSPEAAHALAEAIRRVGTIAVVHETLERRVDESLDFDQVMDRLVAMAMEFSDPSRRARARREGSVGMLPADVATPLAMVLTELIQNAVEHGIGRGGTEVVVFGSTDFESLRLAVEDDGPGISDAATVTASGRLGTQIVATLVGDLGGTITWVAPRMHGEPGTRVELRVPLHSTDDPVRRRG